VAGPGFAEFVPFIAQAFHPLGHTVFDAGGVPKLDFFKVHAHCP
jgi:hypothetical protein